MTIRKYEYPCLVTKGDCLRMEVLDGELTLSFHSEKFGIPGFDPTVKIPLSRASGPYLDRLRDAIWEHVRASSWDQCPVRAELLRDKLSIQVYSVAPTPGTSTDLTRCHVDFLVDYPSSAGVILNAEAMWQWIQDMERLISYSRRASTPELEEEVNPQEKSECHLSKQNTSSSSSNTVGALGCSALSSELMVGMAFPTEPCCARGAK